MRRAWAPLFAIARHDQPAPGVTRTSLLWNAVTWLREEADRRTEFHLGPLLSVTANDRERRVAIGNGLFGFARSANAGWRAFWLDFPAKAATDSRTATTP